MDILKAEIAARKRKASNIEAEESGSKYVRRGEEIGERNEVERQQATDGNLSHPLKGRVEQVKDGAETQDSTGRAKSSTPDRSSAGRESPGSSEQREVFNISNAEAIRRLRAKGEPIRLFDESDKDRRLRLRALELIEERGEKMGQNDFMRALRGAESSMLSQDLEARKGSRTEAKEDDKSQAHRDGSGDGTEKKDNGEGREGVGMGSVLDLGLIKRDINKVYPIIYYTLKGLMRDWEQTLAERPIEVRQSNQGKLVAATQVQTSEYMKPLFKQLRHRSVKPDVLARLAEIVHFVQKREYRHANDAYLQLSIGNAPWPIGVTMVGIHERSGREKINSSNVAHVLNDEVSRKYIQSLKRLMTFAQTRYPPKDVSMLMG